MTYYNTNIHVSIVFFLNNLKIIQFNIRVFEYFEYFLNQVTFNVNICSKCGLF